MCELPCIQAGPYITHNTQFMYSNPNVICKGAQERGVYGGTVIVWEDITPGRPGIKLYAPNT